MLEPPLYSFKHLVPALGFSNVIPKVRGEATPASNIPPVKFAASKVELPASVFKLLPVVPPLKSYWYVKDVSEVDVSVTSTLFASNEPVKVNSCIFVVKFGAGIDGAILIKFFLVLVTLLPKLSVAVNVTSNVVSATYVEPV